MVGTSGTSAKKDAHGKSGSGGGVSLDCGMSGVRHSLTWSLGEREGGEGTGGREGSNLSVTSRTSN